MDRPVLQSLLGDLSIDTFLADSWPDRLVLTHGPLERLAVFKEEEALRDPARLLQIGHRSVRVLYRAGDGRPRQMVVDPPTALQMYQDLGCSLCITAGELPAVRPWVERLEGELGLPRGSTTFNVYVSPDGRGLSMHYDATRKIVVQIEGKKRWRVAPNAHVEAPTTSFSNEDLEPPDGYDGRAGPWPIAMPPDAEELTLEPGSVLFLPRGWWHETEAGGASISVSITLAPPDWAQVITAAMIERLRRDPRWRESAAGLWTDGPPRERALERLQSRLDELRGWLSTLSAEEIAPPPAPRDPLARVTRPIWARPVRRSPPK